MSAEVCDDGCAGWSGSEIGNEIGLYRDLRAGWGPRDYVVKPLNTQVGQALASGRATYRRSEPIPKSSEPWSDLSGTRGGVGPTTLAANGLVSRQPAEAPSA